MDIAPHEDTAVDSDEALLATLARGDARAERALGVLYRRHAATILGMASRSLVDDAAAADVAQDVFVGVWRSASSFDPKRGSARAWILRAAANRIANELRRRQRRPGDGTLDVETLAIASDGPAEEALAAYRRRVLLSALDELPAAQRRALVLAYVDDLTHQQVAAALGLPLGTIKTRIRSALGTLRRRLAPVAAALAVLLLVSGTWLIRMRTDLALDEAALSLVTSSDTANLRLAAVAPAPPQAHARYRGRPGSGLAVVALSSFPPTAEGEHDVVWVRHGSRWIALGSVSTDATGNGRAIFAVPDDGALPEQIVVSRETGVPGTAPGGAIVAAWPDGTP
ncbi:sigma-70 family RNA polymerase sigma factor [Candidatus Binatia bacterium]|nr:sigma-70 family RNA polymerase sigma factor [Candidatus Binatia bacterium]